MALFLTTELFAQTRFEVLGTFDAGTVRAVGPVGALGASVVMRHGRTELRAGASRFGIFTGCSGICDLTDASVAEGGAGVTLGARALDRAWTAGFIVARVHERYDTPRPMAALYVRRPWPLLGALIASTEFRVHAIPVRGYGARAGWAIRFGLGLATAGLRAREP
jgi:hypothetical protein